MIRNFFPRISFQTASDFLGWCLLAVDLLGGVTRVPQQQATEDDLAVRMSRGDDRAFEELYGRYFDPIYGFVKRRVGTQEIAEDLVSTIFLKAFASRSRFTRGSFKAWLYCIANNTIIDYYRTKKTCSMPSDELPDLPNGEPFVSDTIDNQHLRSILETAIARLDTRSQRVLQLKFFSELTNDEIAVALKISTNHAGVLIHRALKKCAKFLPKSITL